MLCANSMAEIVMICYNSSYASNWTKAPNYIKITLETFFPYLICAEHSSPGY
jgi:hypothetical protein